MTIELRQEGALIDGFKPGYFGCECSKKPDCGCPDTGDTPTPPGPEPPTPDTGITSIHIIVADTITDSGMASAVFTPATADTSLYYSSSDDSIAEIDPDTGEITVIQTGVVTFCVEDLYTGLEDCKTVNVIKSEGPDTGDTGSTGEYVTFVFNVLSTIEPAWIAEDSIYPHYDKMIIDDGPEIDFNPRYTFSTTGIHRVRLRLIHPDNMDRANEIVWAGSTTTSYTHCYLIEYYVPKTVETMNIHMQSRNDMVEKITLYPTTPPVLDPGPNCPQYCYSYMFNNISLFYVPAQSLSAYKTAPGWSNVADRFRAITG